MKGNASVGDINAAGLFLPQDASVLQYSSVKLDLLV